MTKMIDLTGRKFERLTVIERAENKGERVCWKCKCDCGKEVIVYSKTLLSGATKSCGCLHKEINSNIHKTHGKSKSRIYRIWSGMLRRCNNKNDKRYTNYGGRGIKVEFKSFEEFYDWSINNGYKDNLTIYRIDNNGNYSKSNCRWTDNKTQTNNKRNNHYITLNNETKTLMQWCEFYKMDYDLVKNRINNLYWEPLKALTTPKRTKNK